MAASTVHQSKPLLNYPIASSQSAAPPNRLNSRLGPSGQLARSLCQPACAAAYSWLQ
ncbi:hypothetical protein [Rubidibacter lacunae]|uniref:hypothetical protein n=1 Tax=Rubidibacter lacunae TaxID=582514 RepID=UPI00042A4691|nr:hypothetical protein [Rubidibacter lacunae]